MEFKIEKIEDLGALGISHLVQESKAAGFRFLEKLVNDYQNGTNRFNKHGESLLGVYNKQGVLIAIGGLNNDPYSNDPKIGRLRRFYVASNFRRSGVGTLLLNKIMLEAKKYYEGLVLHTDTVQGDLFYTAFGFSKTCDYPNSTHYINF
ncbi:GNAT family N-acetyltransferase [Bacillus sp. DTU_2020_1000418_1_SI_GHA_SEK_038]|uniref:GNAT family N-acetyltransferase n=1 Tax=Bacillus sp. DTU_2020_1000418_1_SI_GHA_SEK_038 TaxID=3077585 RepID=UPI0028E42C83|nr:GNAT family N-acetyltransferase [Bacillus sp. DTU_2020_1000418_1_SI_GHA_SEK_038]WNS76255.1 GNAT family N-acetyltransferase [Bacillus sp. DTU_2020_1000418_1_SI_GHA_SEK_038]